MSAFQCPLCEKWVWGGEDHQCEPKTDPYVDWLIAENERMQKERDDAMKACKGLKQDLEQVQHARDGLQKELNEKSDDYDCFVDCVSEVVETSTFDEINALFELRMLGGDSE